MSEQELSWKDFLNMLPRMTPEASNEEAEMFWEEHDRIHARDDEHFTKWLISVEFRDPSRIYGASVRRNGCVHLYRYHNGQPMFEYFPLGHDPEDSGDIDYMYICDIDDMIARLQALKQAAGQAFGKEWPDL